MCETSVQHTNIASDNGLSPVQRQAIIWTIPAMLSIRTEGTYFSEILFKMQKFSFKEMHLEMSSAQVAAILAGLNMLIQIRHNSTKCLYWSYNYFALVCWCYALLLIACLHLGAYIF